MVAEAIPNFSQRQCIRSLQKIGFLEKSKRRGKHFKFVPPERIKQHIQPGQPPFLMVPRHRELRVQHQIIRELRAMGGDTLVEEFLQSL